MSTPAPCCLQALQDATKRWPTRNRASDGIMGDASHQARKSDHNDGNAFDLTHDPAHGVDCHTLSRQVIGDSRVTYVIWDGHIYNQIMATQGWRAYTGTNPHNHHMHVSIALTSRNDMSPWPWSVAPVSPVLKKPVVPRPYPGTPLQQGSFGSDVRVLQQRLQDLGKPITVDGIFGQRTRTLVVDLQRGRYLLPDGIVGPKTWSALWLP